MNWLPRIVVWLTFVIALTACTLEIPSAVSASAQRYSKGAPAQTWRLNENQVHALSEWFAEHKSGWSLSYVTYVPNLEVSVVHADGKHSSINIWSPQKVIVNSDAHQMEQEFDPKVVQALSAIVEARGG